MCESLALRTIQSTIVPTSAHRTILVILVLQQLWNSYFRPAWQRVREIKPFSWEVLLLLSLFSWVVTLLLREPMLAAFVRLLAWIFLIAGISWALADKSLNVLGLKIKYGAWIAGALTSLFLYVEDLSSGSTALVLWPLISGIYGSLPKFVRRGPALAIPRPGDRQEIVIRLLICTLISCWIQFYFSLQNLLERYPSLLLDNFEASAFVVRLNPVATYPSRGVLILETATAILQEEFENRPLGAIELWLRDLNANIAAVEAQVWQRLGRIEEDRFWRLQAVLTSGLPEYTLDLQAIWFGPSSRVGGYRVERTCRIQQDAAQNVTPEGGRTTIISTGLTCDPIELPEFLLEQDPVEQDPINQDPINTVQQGDHRSAIQGNDQT